MQRIAVRGVDVPVLGFGTWELKAAQAYDAVRTALEVGYRHIDTAQMYGNEDEVGRAIADSDLDRDEVFIATKIPPRNAAREAVRTSHEDSLRKLRTDRVDLLLLHWPADPPLEETLDAMHRLQQDGKTSMIGVSNFTSDLLRRALDIAPVVTNQVEYHPYLDQHELLTVVAEHELMLTAYSPLAKGRAARDDTLVSIGRAHGKSATQVALRWLIQQPHVSAIPRSGNPDHIRANFDIWNFELSDDDMKRIADRGHSERVIDPPWAPDWD